MTHITRSAHACKPAGTVSASLEFDGLSIDVFAYDLTPASRRKVERMAKAIDATLKLADWAREVDAR